MPYQNSRCYETLRLEKGCSFMRNTLALCLVGCALFGGAAAQAQFLPISDVTPASLSFTPGVGGSFVFNGTVTNNTGFTIEGVLPSVTVNPFTPSVNGDASNFALAFNPLSPGQQYVGELFTIDIAPAQVDPFTVFFDVQGLDVTGGNVSRATGSFRLNVTSAVPEPGTVALMVGMTSLGGMLTLRRHRK